jgi:hypothetical protein
MKCHTNKMLQDQNVAVVKHHSTRNVGWTYSAGKMLHGRFVGGRFIKAPTVSGCPDSHTVCPTWLLHMSSGAGQENGE